MPSYLPTARELCLLGSLLALLLISSATWKPSTSPISPLAKLHSNQSSSGHDQEPTFVTYESQFSVQSLHAPLSWDKGEIPQTEVVTHVPGKFSTVLLHGMYMLTKVAIRTVLGQYHLHKTFCIVRLHRMDYV